MKLSVFIKQNREFLISLLCFFSLFLNSQSIPNLVNNYSFEQSITCPSGLGGVYPLGIVNYWFTPHYYATSEYFNLCATNTNVSVPTNIRGNQLPRTGNGYIGSGFYDTSGEGRENIENGLKQILKINKSYCVTFYVSLAECSRFTISNIGAYFTQDSLKNYWPIVSPINYFLIPHIENLSMNFLADTLNWLQVQGTYTANGTERFITLGNFRNDLTTNIVQTKPLPAGGGIAYYYIDDVSVVEINPANSNLKDTIFICPTNTLVLGTDSTWDATYSWQEAGAGSSLSCTNCPNPIATPTITTKYFLTKQQCSATTVDSVLVIVIIPTTLANAGPDKNICPNEIVQLGTADSTNYVSYNWQFIGNGTLSCTNCAMPLANTEQTTDYILQRTECGNTTRDTVKVIIDYCDIVIPTVFTPNGDDINDTWKFKLPTGAKLSELNVYNRWGLLMHSINSNQLILKSVTTTLNIIWDGYTTAGISCNEGTYFYTLTYTDKNNETKNLKGYVSLFK